VGDGLARHRHLPARYAGEKRILLVSPSTAGVRTLMGCTKWCPFGKGYVPLLSPGLMRLLPGRPGVENQGAAAISRSGSQVDQSENFPKQVPVIGYEQGVCFFPVPAYFLRSPSKIKEDNNRMENNTDGNFSRMTKRDQDSSSGQKTGTGRE